MYTQVHTGTLCIYSQLAPPPHLGSPADVFGSLQQADEPSRETHAKRGVGVVQVGPFETNGLKGVHFQPVG